MKAKIDKDGHLWLERAGKLKLQECPQDSYNARCGDWCPLFDEYLTKPADAADPRYRTVEIRCAGVWIYLRGAEDEFVDEREGA